MEKKGSGRQKNKRRIGAQAEACVRAYLEAQGMEILEQNFYCRSGEIDLIGKDQGYLVFLEVKYRKSEKSGHPAEAVGYAKQKRICRAADYYRYIHRISENIPVRYDVVTLMEQKISWYQNAFPHRY